MTFVSYPNITAHSENEEFRIEITGRKSEKISFRDQSKFIYRLVHNPTNEELWTWQPDEEGRFADYPHEAWVNDLGWVVVRLHEWFHAGLLVLSPQGRLSMLRLLQSFSDEDEPGILQDETEEHIGSTSAGPDWQASSISGFHLYAGKPYWSILTWWGRRILIDLEAGSVVDNVPDAHNTKIDSEERRWVISILSRVNQLTESDRWSSLMFDCYSAAYQTGCLKVGEAEPQLRELETCSITGGSRSCEWFSFESLPLRSIAKISLLRNGLEPTWHSNMIIKNSKSEAICDYPSQTLNRTEEMFKEGMSQRQLLKEVGTPEYIRKYWDYSSGPTSAPDTIRIHWHNKHDFERNPNEPFPSEKFAEYRRLVNLEPPVIKKVERVELPIWIADPIREYAIAHVC